MKSVNQGSSIENNFVFSMEEGYDEPCPEFQDMLVENITDRKIDHPGASDEEYRRRKDEIKGLAKKFRETKVIADVEYTSTEQNTWRLACEKLEQIQAKHANSFYLQAKKDLGISNYRIPQLREMNMRLKRMTNFRLVPVEGLLETRYFLKYLYWRTMHSTQYIRHESKPEYTPEPDIVHEAIGHIPMFTNRDFVNFSRFIGLGARIATEEELVALGRLYWFTVEFGLIEEGSELKAYGAGLLSSFGELEHAFTDQVQRRPFDLEEIINTDYEYSEMQKVLFIIKSYADLVVETKKYIEGFKNFKS